MIYDSVLFTGAVTISGCSSSDLHTDNFLQLNRETAGSLSEFYYDRSVASGDNRLQLSLNSQTLVQEKPITGLAVNEISYQVNTGDFFVKGEEVDISERNKLFFDDTTPIKPTSEIFYNVVSGSGIMSTSEGDFGQSLKTSILVSLGATEASFNDFDYFLNGQKVYSGDGVGVSLGTDNDFIPLFSTAANVAGVVRADNKNEFKYSAYKKRFRSTSITGVFPDIHGSPFIEKRTNFYINGMSELQSNYLELFTGVTIIKSGTSALISGGIEGNKFEVISKIETLLL
jgi:hypothetical protein